MLKNHFDTPAEACEAKGSDGKLPLLLKYLVKTQVHKIRCFKKKFRPIVRKIATAKWEKHDDGRVKLHTIF